MNSLEAYPVLNFSGGVRRDKGLPELHRDELLDGRNIHIDQQGRIRTRLGSQQFGQTLTGTIENSFVYSRTVLGSTPTVRSIVNNSASPTILSEHRGSRVSTAVAVGDTSIVMTGNPSGFPSSGTVEIEGDLIAYTGLSVTTLTGVTGITSAHPVGAAINTWITLSQSGTGMDGRMGITYAVLNNILFMVGRTGNMKQYDGSNITDVTGEPGVLFLTDYRDRLYGAGDGSSGGSANADPRRISFSNRVDGTTWTTASDYFDVEDQRAEYVTALRVFNDRLGIFKTNSTYTYDELELKQHLTDVGAYNNKVVQEINGLLYTFCPEGIFATNLFSSKQIGEPVREFWENFVPKYDAIGSRVCTNTFSWTYVDSYFLYIGNITSPTTTSDVVLEYNVGNKAWTIHDGGYTNFAHVKTMRGFKFGDGDITFRPSFFGGDTGGKVWRLFENKYLDGGATPTVRGGDINKDLISDTGTPISPRIETPLYDLGHPSIFKAFKRIRFYTEQGNWSVEYRVEDEEGITDYKPLGNISKTNQILPFSSKAQGWRIGLRISGAKDVATGIFNGFVFEETGVLPRA